MAVSLYRAARLVLTRYPRSVLSRNQPKQPAFPPNATFYSTQQAKTQLAKTDTPSSSHEIKELEALIPIKGTLRNSKSTADEVISALNYLKPFVEENGAAKLETERSFINFCNSVGKNCSTYNNKMLIICLKTVLDLGLSPQSYLVKSLETEVLWRLRNFNPKQLATIFTFHLKHQKDELQVKVLKETAQTIQRRWVEINSVKEVGFLLLLQEHFNKEFLQKLEDRAVDTMEKASVDDMAKFWVLLAKLKQRPPAVLRSLAFHLGKHSGKLNAKQIANVFCAMNSLSFPDELLLGRLSNDLLDQIEAVENSTVIGAILTSIGQLKWKHPELLNAISEWILANKDKCRSKDLVAFTLTTAGLSYIPNKEEEIFQLIFERLTEETVASPGIWLDIVRSLVILEKATESHLCSVLKPSFSEKLASVSSKLKLLHVNLAAKCEFPSYKGPFVSPEAMSAEVHIQDSKETEKQRLLVCDALSNFLPKGKFMNTRKVIDNCIIVDAEFAVNDSSKPLSLENHTKYFNSIPPCQLPPGVHKMCVVVLDFKDYSLNVHHLTGGNVLWKRLLQKLNYKVVEVPFMEFSRLDTTLKKVQYLQKKISDCVSKSESKDL